MTNDVTSFKNTGSNESMYACILSPQGRYLHDLFIHTNINNNNNNNDTTGPHGNHPSEALLDVDSSSISSVISILKRYRLRQKIEIDDVSSDFQVWVGFGQSDSSSENQPRDPRLDALGWRTVLPEDNPNGNPKPTSTWQAYRRWRMKLGVAEGDLEIPNGEAIPLEYNIDALHGISFTKGCYVGQELMARTHFKGVVRKRLMPVSIVGESLPVGEKIINRDKGSSGLGTLRAQDGELGLAHVRLEEAMRAIAKSAPLTTESGALLYPSRPLWWPESWGN